MNKPNTNYSSIHAIKSFANNDLIPKYFDPAKVGNLNIGLIGYTTELIGNSLEDSFNTMTTFLNEFFPMSATFPETIYNYASMGQLDEVLATPSELTIFLMISEEDIIAYGTPVKGASGEIYEFFLDSDMKIMLEDFIYHPDYDIRIVYRPYKGDYIFTANYHMIKHNTTYNNKSSNLTNPYIRLKRILVEGKKYVMLQVQTHQITKFEQSEVVLSNSIINLPTFRVDYEGMLSNIEVFYKENGRNYYTQLIRKPDNSLPENKPFFYYRQVDKTPTGGTIEIFFSARDKYFRPEQNSDIIISYHTTRGKEANFEKYMGKNDIRVIPSGNIYQYNNNLTIFSYTTSSSFGGKDVSDFETVRYEASEALSTNKSYTTENDLMLYFSKYNRNNDHSNIIPIKKRDDISSRVFNAFTFFKNKKEDIIHSNTLNITLKKSDFDSYNSQSKIHILKPNHLFKYDGNSLTTCVVREGTIGNHTTINPNEFVYACPYTILFMGSPTAVGYYMNTINEHKIVDYEYINDTTTNQFICNEIHIQRDAVKDNFYTLTIKVSPISKLPNPIVKEGVDSHGTKTFTKTYALLLRLTILSGDTAVGESDFMFDSFDMENGVYTYKTIIKTDDEITINNRIRVLNLPMKDGGGVTNKDPKLIPMENCKAIITAYYTDDEANNIPSVQDNELADVSKYIITNKYSTDTNRIHFVYPIGTSRSDAIYNDLGSGDFNITITDVPLVEYKVMEDKEYFWEFYEYIFNIYKYLDQIKTLKTNNYGMDCKFYNTFGRGKNFTVGDEGSGQILDRVNIKIHLEVRPLFGINTDELIRDLKAYIKAFIEDINNTKSNGSNAIYISNLIQSIENQFEAVHYLKFKKINEYSSDIQVIENSIVDLTKLDKNARLHYVPEYLTIQSDNIIIDII